MQLLYGPNADEENQPRFNLPEFNKLDERARVAGLTWIRS